ncbi:MAG: hypothetical protein ACM3ME_02910 [Chloroflexota bacterium]|jgi:hypothetical protein|nr:hypothetical protein [Lentimicrobium sp.]
MCFNISFNQQLSAFRKDGTILAPDGNINEEGYWNFRDWKCDASTLSDKAQALMQLAGTFVSDHPELNADRFYVMFRNTENREEYSSYEISIADVRGSLHTMETMMFANELQSAN